MHLTNALARMFRGSAVFARRPLPTDQAFKKEYLAANQRLSSAATFTAATTTASSGEFVQDFLERRVKLAAYKEHSSDNHDGNSRREQTIFDRRGARFIPDERQMGAYAHLAEVSHCNFSPMIPTECMPPYSPFPEKT